MCDSCQSRHSDSIGVLCSAVFWSQNNNPQLQNLTIKGTLGDSVGTGNHPAVAPRTNDDKAQINSVSVPDRQNTFFVTNNDVQNRLETNHQPRILVTSSYVEGGMDIVSGRDTVVFDSIGFRVASSCTQQEAYVLAPATLSSIYYGFLVVDSRLSASGNDVARLGRSLDVNASINSQVVVRDSAISEGFNTAEPWADVVISNRPLAGNTGSVDDNDEVQRGSNDTSYNRIWEYSNHDVGNRVVAGVEK